MWDWLSHLYSLELDSKLSKAVAVSWVVSLDMQAGVVSMLVLLTRKLARYK